MIIFNRRKISKVIKYNIYYKFYQVNYAYGDYNIFIWDKNKLPTKTKTLKALTENIQSIKNLSATLYFDESAVFPRYKLQESEFKRCIKPKKADYIVISDVYSKNTELTLIEKDFVDRFLILQVDDEYMITDASLAGKIDEIKQIIFHDDTLKSQYSTNIVNLRDVKIIYDGPVILTNCSQLQFDYNMGYFNVPFITDKSLEQCISNNLTSMTFEDVLSIKDMLQSDNEDVVKLGLKILPSYNIWEIPNTIKILLLLTNYNWTKAQCGIITKSLFESLNYEPICFSFPRCLSYFQKVDNISDKDKEMCVKLLKQPIQDYINKNILDVHTKLNNLNMSDIFQFKFDVTII